MSVIDEPVDETGTVDLDIETVVYTTDPTNEEECWEKFSNLTTEASEALCPTAWDSFYCWGPAQAGASVHVPCEEIFPFFDSSNYQKGYAYRECGVDGRWSWGNWTNYSECMDLLQTTQEAISPVTVSYIIFIGSLISLISLGITLFIFSYFKSLQCSRIRVHRNLVLSLILHSLMMLTISLPGIFEHIIDSFRDTNWFCKLILTVKMYSAMTCIYWMFVEGLLLHSSITVSVFQQEPPFKLYYAIGWGIPFACVLSWVVLMAVLSSSPCWQGYGRSPFIWLITGPMILALVVNSVFLINIIRILITKLRMSVSIEIKQIKKAIKATALLFPLLGITHLLFCINPRDDAHLEHAYMITNAMLQSSQGLFVAVLYCFLNSEVQSVLMNSYMRAALRRHPGRTFRSGSRMVSATTTTSLSHSVDQVSSSSVGANRIRTGHKLVLPLKPVPEVTHEDVEAMTLMARENSILCEKETSFIN